MKILFVCSGNSGDPDRNPVVFNQARSLEKQGVVIDYFLIRGKGWMGYLKNIFLLKRYLAGKSYDLIHAHYSYSGVVAGLAVRAPVIVSFMGCDVLNAGVFWKIVIRFFSRYFWEAVIVKSGEMKRHSGLEKAFVVPNGIDLVRLVPQEQDLARRKVGFGVNKNVVFITTDPGYVIKNFSLAREAVRLLGRPDIELHLVTGTPHSEIASYLSAADVLLLTSLTEGSPNIIKEAMACNCPIVSTDVGDVREVIGNTEGCYLAGFDPEDVARKLDLALSFGRRTKGRERIGIFDEKGIAEDIRSIYHGVLESKTEKMNSLSSHG